jgi:hypothetical protein
VEQKMPTNKILTRKLYITKETTSNIQNTAVYGKLQWNAFMLKSKVKVKVTLEQAMKAQKGRRKGTGLLLL